MIYPAVIHQRGFLPSDNCTLSNVRALNIVAKTGEQTERCVSLYSWIFGVSLNVSMSQRTGIGHVYNIHCICCNYAVHALHQRYISYSTPHFTPQNSLLKTSNSSRPGLTQGQGARTSQETQREETRNWRKGKIYCASRG